MAPQRIHYCDRCGRIITPSTLESGKAVIVGDQSFCEECAKAAGKFQALKPTRTPAPTRRPTSRRADPVSPQRPATTSIPLKVLGIAGFVAGVLGGTAVTLLLARNGEVSEDPAPVFTVAAPATPAAAENAPAPAPATPVEPEPEKPAPPEPTPPKDPEPAPVEEKAKPAPPPATPAAAGTAAAPVEEPAPQSNEPGALRDGLVAHWTFDDASPTRAVDASGKGNHVTLNANANPRAPGKIGKALRIKNNRVDLGAAPSLDVRSFTVALWAKPARVGKQYIISKCRGYRDGGWNVLLQGKGGVAFELRGFDRHNAPSRKQDAYEADEWIHIAGVFDDAKGRGTLYLNGVPVATGTGALVRAPASQSVRFGVGSWPNGYTGLVDDVRIYDRPLEAHDIKMLHAWNGEALAQPASEPAAPETASNAAATTGGAAPSQPAELTGAATPSSLKEGLIGHWRLDESAGLIARDASGSEAAGTLKGGAKWAPGKIGGAVSLGAPGDRVEIPDYPALESLSQALSVSCWVKRQGASGDKRENLVNRWGGKNSFMMFYEAGKVFLFLATDKGGTVPREDVPLADNRWHHLALVYDGSHMRFYVDGALVTSAARAGNLSNNRGSLKIGGGLKGRMDDVRLYNRALDVHEVTLLHTWWDRELARLAPTAAEREALMAEASIVLADTGYSFTVPIVQTLAKAHRPDAVVAKKLATVGGTLAASRTFSAGVKTKLSAHAGYLHAGTRGLAAKNATTAHVVRSLSRSLEREKPEVVRVCFDVADIVAKLPLADTKRNLTAIVERMLERGSVPVLYTIPIRAPADAKLTKLLQDHNAMVVALADRIGVPCVDAWGVLNAADAAAKRYVSARGAVTSKGMATIDELFLNLYGSIERWVFNRGRDAIVAAAPKEEPRKPVVTPEDDARPKPEPQPVTKTPTPPPPPKRTPAVGVGENVVVNGAFEVAGDDPRMPRVWRSHDWGSSGARFSVRLDRSNPHDGEYAVRVLPLAAGGKPGIFSPLGLTEGKYVVSYWACADVGETATVRAHLAGVDLPERTVKDDWQQFTETVQVGPPRTKNEDDDEPAPPKTVRGSVRLMSLTPKVRVWFDDVVVAPVR